MNATPFRTGVAAAALSALSLFGMTGSASAQNEDPLASFFRYSVGFAGATIPTSTDYLGANFQTNGTLFGACVDGNVDYWSAALRYAGEFSGFRIAAGVTATACATGGDASGIFPGNGLPHITQLGVIGLIGGRVGVEFPLLQSQPARPSGVRALVASLFLEAGFALADVTINVPGVFNNSGTRNGTFFGASLYLNNILPVLPVNGITDTAVYVRWRHVDLGTGPGPVPTNIVFELVQFGVEFRY